MSTNSFSFPPPPPPPPQLVTYPETAHSSTSSRGRGDNRWERGPRGRGRGIGQRGSRGGSHSYGPNPPGPASQSRAHYGGSYPLPNYPPVQQPQYPVDPPNFYGTSPPPYAPVASPSVPPQNYPYYPPPYQVAQPQATSYQYASPNYNSQVPQYPYQLPNEHLQHSNDRYASPPTGIAPPMRMGFGDQDVMTSRRAQPAHHDQFNSSASRPTHGQRGGHGPHNRRGNSHGNPFSANFRGKNSTTQPTNTSTTRGTQVAPAVPSFGNPLPVKPPIPQVEVKKSKKKKKRRVNQLGLTPKNDEHVSSSEEEDIDEEMKLAAAASVESTTRQLQITYKGQTSTLQNPDDIASWLEERKKRFPTAARRAEKEEQLRKDREEREEKKRAAKLLERQKRTLEKDKQANEQDKQDAAAKAKLKVEKLRKRLEKEERRIAKSEAKSLKRSKVEADEEPIPEAKRLKIEASPDGNKSVPFVTTLGASNDLDEKSNTNTEADTSNPMPDPLTPTSQPALPDSEIKLDIKLDQSSSDSKTPQPAITNGDANQAVTNSERHHNGNVNSTLSTDTTSVSSDETLEDDNEDDDTSSSGSSSSSESDAEGPEPVSLRSKGPQKARPPKRVDKQEKAVCRDFLKTGRCRRGKRCRWRHALPERGRRKQEEETPFRVERKSLHQRLVEQELEKERQEKAKLEQHDHQTLHDTPTTVK